MTINGKTNSVYLSVVIPVYNEQNNIKILLALLAENINPLHVKYEIIIIDDGSNDDTWLEINESIKSSKHIKGIKLSRNFGHQHALLAGLNHAKGKAIISMDGDLQHPPSVIPEMVEMHKNGHLVVNTFRNDTEVSSFFKRKSSSLFYKVFSFLTEVPMMAGSSDFRLIDRIVLNQLLKFKDIDLFIRGSVQWLGFSSITLPYTANKRYSGTSKYNLLKMLKFAGGSVVSFSTKPLVLGIWIGIFTSIFAFIENF